MTLGYNPGDILPPRVYIIIFLFIKSANVVFQKEWNEVKKKKNEMCFD